MQLHALEESGQRLFSGEKTSSDRTSGDSWSLAAQYCMLLQYYYCLRSLYVDMNTWFHQQYNPPGLTGPGLILGVWVDCVICAPSCVFYKVPLMYFLLCAKNTSNLSLFSLIICFVAGVRRNLPMAGVRREINHNKLQFALALIYFLCYCIFQFSHWKYVGIQISHI